MKQRVNARVDPGVWARTRATVQGMQAHGYPSVRLSSFVGEALEQACREMETRFNAGMPFTVLDDQTRLRPGPGIK